MTTVHTRPPRGAECERSDLALSLLRYAVEHCDEPPALPETVRVAG